MSEIFDSRENFISFFTRRKNIVEKNKFILDLCKHKDVLDLGCIDHSSDTALSLGDKWLHKQIKDVSKSLTGVDILSKDAQILNTYSYNIVAADVETFNLGKTFDVIVAGDLIEHLSNIGMFLNCVKEHMNEQSIFVVTTPNPFNIEQMMAAVFDNKIYVNDEHTVWISPHNMWVLMKRAGLEIVDFCWVDTRFSFKVKRTVYGFFANKLSNMILNKRNLCRRDFAVVVKKK